MLYVSCALSTPPFEYIRSAEEVGSSAHCPIVLIKDNALEAVALIELVFWDGEVSVALRADER